MTTRRRRHVSTSREVLSVGGTRSKTRRREEKKSSCFAGHQELRGTGLWMFELWLKGCAGVWVMYYVNSHISPRTRLVSLTAKTDTAWRRKRSPRLSSSCRVASRENLKKKKISSLLLLLRNSVKNFRRMKTFVRGKTSLVARSCFCVVGWIPTGTKIFVFSSSENYNFQYYN